MADAKYTELKWEWLDHTLVAGPKQTHLLYANEAPGLGSQADEVRRVIAAAPDLLAAVEAKLKAEYRDEHEQADELLSDAYRKATGAVDA